MRDFLRGCLVPRTLEPQNRIRFSLAKEMRKFRRKGLDSEERNSHCGRCSGEARTGVKKQQRVALTTHTFSGLGSSSADASVIGRVALATARAGAGPDGSCSKEETDSEMGE